jgi:hypothetical protein
MYNYSAIKSTDYLYPGVVDWRQVFRDLADHGCAGMKAAHLLGESQSTLWRWAHGVEPRFSKASAVLLLHTRYCGLELTRQRLAESSRCL